MEDLRTIRNGLLMKQLYWLKCNWFASDFDQPYVADFVICRSQLLVQLKRCFGTCWKTTTLYLKDVIHLNPKGYGLGFRAYSKDATFDVIYLKVVVILPQRLPSSVTDSLQAWASHKDSCETSAPAPCAAKMSLRHGIFHTPSWS